MKLHTYLLLLSAFVVLSAHAAKLPIMALPATITGPGDYYFPSDLNYTVPVDFAIVVNATGPVTIDMKGFTLRGSAQAIQILSNMSRSKMAQSRDSSMELKPYMYRELHWIISRSLFRGSNALLCCMQITP